MKKEKRPFEMPASDQGCLFAALNWWRNNDAVGKARPRVKLFVHHSDYPRELVGVPIDFDQDWVMIDVHTVDHHPLGERYDEKKKDFMTGIQFVNAAYVIRVDFLRETDK